MWQCLKDNLGILGLFVAVLPVLWAIWSYFVLKRKELRSERFRIYHLLIKQLVQPDEGTDKMWLDRQLAIVFEFRRFPEYFEPSLRILKGLRKSWAKQAEEKNVDYGRLFDEMDVTIPEIEKRSRWVWHRIKRWLRRLFIET